LKPPRLCHCGNPPAGSLLVEVYSFGRTPKVKSGAVMINLCSECLEALKPYRGQHSAKNRVFSTVARLAPQVVCRPRVSGSRIRPRQRKLPLKAALAA
jgi:hypothetical protein